MRHGEGALGRLTQTLEWGLATCEDAPSRVVSAWAPGRARSGLHHLVGCVPCKGR